MAQVWMLVMIRKGNAWIRIERSICITSARLSHESMWKFLVVGDLHGLG